MLTIEYSIRQPSLYTGWMAVHVISCSASSVIARHYVHTISMLTIEYSIRQPSLYTGWMAVHVISCSASSVMLGIMYTQYLC